MLKTLAAAAVTACALADDPSGSWLSYAEVWFVSAACSVTPSRMFHRTEFTLSHPLLFRQWTDPAGGIITNVTATWTVPDLPSQLSGSNAPGWWFGVQTAKGDGALVQPILAYGYTGDHYSIFNGVFDWTDESWHTSPEVLTVKPGDVIFSWLAYEKADNSYTMYIKSTEQNKGITTNYKIERRQTAPESTAYFVLEHQPRSCKAYPANGECTFHDIYLELGGQAVASPKWTAAHVQNACNSEAVIVDPATIKFTWDTKAATEAVDQAENFVASNFTYAMSKLERKWGYGVN
jgi:hypothetical protein